MLADFCIPRISNDTKIVIQNHLGGQIFNRILDPSKKTASIELPNLIFFLGPKMCSSAHINPTLISKKVYNIIYSIELARSSQGIII